MGIGYRSPILNTPYSQSESSSCSANTQASHYWRAMQLNACPIDSFHLLGGNLPREPKERLAVEECLVKS